MFLHQFKKFAHLIRFGVLAGGLHGKGARHVRMDPDHVTALGTIMLESESTQQFLELAKAECGARIG